MKKRHASHRALVFCRFCRKGYAVFASLHREVCIGVLTVSMLTSVQLPKVQAKQPAVGSGHESEADEQELAEVTVAGTMTPLSELQAARMVSVITRQQIEQSSAQSVNDLLKLAVGVDVRQRGGFGIQSDISIDGGTFDQITLLLNGVNISSPHTGHLSADFPVSLSDIERIEILEGAASRVYGASAFGGAINIVTKREDSPSAFAMEGVNTPKSSSIEAGLQGGSYATMGADARIAFRQANSFFTGGVWGGSLSSTFLRSDGATTNSDFCRGQLYTQGQYNVGDVCLHWQGGWSRKSYGANTFYSAAYPNQYERNDRFIVSVGAENRGRVRLRPEVFWYRLVDNFELIRHATTGENFHRSDVIGSRIAMDFGWAAGRTAIGGEARKELIYSTNLGQPLLEDQYIRIHGEDGRCYTNYDDRTNVSFNVEHTILLPHFTASVGVLANRNSYLDERFRLYPGIDLAYRPNSHCRFFASYNKGFRLPTFTDLYYKAPTHSGNVGLHPEESHSFQLGYQNTVQSAKCNIQWSLKTFYHRGRRLIDWVMYNADDVYHSANFDLDNIGVQVQGTLQYGSCDLRVGYTFIHQKRRDDVAVFKSNYALEYLRHKMVATFSHPIVAHLSASWSLRWQDRMGSYLRYENAQSTGQLVCYHPYAILDAKLRWTQPHFELWVEGTNLTNHHYYDLSNIPQPGLLIMTGIRVRY